MIMINNDRIAQLFPQMQTIAVTNASPFICLSNFKLAYIHSDFNLKLEVAPMKPV